MRMEQLKCLVSVAQTGSMNKTAELLFVSPQAVSKALKQLEEELGVTLLVRTRMGVTLTNVGESIVAVAENMVAEEQLIDRIVAESKRESYTERKFSLNIYSTSVINNIILPDIIARFMNANVNIIPRISMVDDWKTLFDSVQNGECDLGLLTYNEEALFQNFLPYKDNLDMNLLARDEMVVVGRSNIRHHNREYMELDEIRKHMFTIFGILPVKGQIYRDYFVNVTRSNDADFHRAMILRTDAYTIMPRIAYQYFFGTKRYMAMPIRGYETPLLHVAVYRKDAPKELRSFVSMLRLKFT